LRAELPTEHVATSWGMEVIRKGIHFLPLSVPIAYAYDLMAYRAIVGLFVSVALVLIGLDFLRLKSGALGKVFFRLFGALIRNHERRSLTGSSFLVFSFAISLVAFPKPIAVAVMYYTVLGDGLASLVGKRWGRIRLGRRSLEGSVACLLACLGIGITVPGLSHPLVILGAAVATAAEGVSIGLDDNLTIPIVSGFTMMGGDRLLT